MPIAPASQRLLRVGAAAALLYSYWLAMLATHEVGHVAFAAVSGGVVQRVELPLLGFSRTDLIANPHPGLVAWGGPVLGCILPLILWMAVCTIRRGVGDDKQHRGIRRIERVVRGFAAFCLIANGAYLGVGGLDRVGDAGDLLHHGTPLWTLLMFGAVALAAGLWLLHTLGRPARGAARDPQSANRDDSRGADYRGP